jgi:NADPH-dependent curcumin reductase CurA
LGEERLRDPIGQVGVVFVQVTHLEGQRVVRLAGGTYRE